MPFHRLHWTHNKGKLMDALGIDRADPQSLEIEAIVEKALANGWSMRQLFERVGDMDISDEMWANFLYTYGWWDGRRRD